MGKNMLIQRYLQYGLRTEQKDEIKAPSTRKGYGLAAADISLIADSIPPSEKTSVDIINSPEDLEDLLRKTEENTDATTAEKRVQTAKELQWKHFVKTCIIAAVLVALMFVINSLPAINEQMEVTRLTMKICCCGIAFPLCILCVLEGVKLVSEGGSVDMKGKEVKIPELELEKEE